MFLSLEHMDCVLEMLGLEAFLESKVDQTVDHNVTCVVASRNVKRCSFELFMFLKPYKPYKCNFLIVEDL